MASPTRRTVVTTALAAAAAGAFLPAQTAAASDTAAASPAARHHRTRALRRAHAHNDYLHPRPLHDALAHGFTSVEADIFLVDGELLVAHEATDLDPSRTLASLYLDPLLDRVRANHGTVHPGYRDPVQLLIDIKTDGAAAYLELDRQLRHYRRMLTSYHHGRVRPGAITPVISGDRAVRVPMEAQSTRYAFYDGRPKTSVPRPAPRSSRSSAAAGPTTSAGSARAPSPRPSGTNCARSSPRPIVAVSGSGSGPPPTRRARSGRRSGRSCWPPGSTTSTPMIWRDLRASCAPTTGRAGPGPSAPATGRT